MQAVQLASSAARLRGIHAASAWTLAQPAYRVDAGMVAVMTPAERFAERRKRRQKPWLAKLEPVGPGPVGRHPSLTGYPGSKPPPFAGRGADGHGRRRVRGIPQPERLSTRHLRGVAPRPALGRTQRPGQRQSRPLCVATSRAGPRPAQGHNLTKRGGVPASSSRLAPDGAAMAGLPEVIGLLYRADWTRLSLSAEVRSETDREPLPRLSREGRSRRYRTWPGQRQDIVHL
jgi:hypothetical protein